MDILNTAELQAKAAELNAQYNNARASTEYQERIMARAKEIMLAAGMAPEFFTSHGPAHGPKEIAIRDQAMSQAREAIATEWGVPQWRPANGGDEINWEAEPRPALALALAARADAEKNRDKCAIIAHNAQAMLAKCENELKQYDGLDIQIEQHIVEMARQGLDDEIPYSLSEASRDRSKLLDKRERAHRAVKTLAGELRDQQRKLEQATRIARLWAQRIIIMDAEKIAAELFETQARADQLRDSLNALSFCTFPGMGGPVELTATLHRALNVQPKPREESYPKIEPLKTPWLKAFAALMENPEATLSGDGEAVSFE